MQPTVQVHSPVRCNLSSCYPIVFYAPKKNTLFFYIYFQHSCLFIHLVINLCPCWATIDSSCYCTVGTHVCCGCRCKLYHFKLKKKLNCLNVELTLWASYPRIIFLDKYYLLYLQYSLRKRYISYIMNSTSCWPVRSTLCTVQPSENSAPLKQLWIIWICNIQKLCW